MIHKFLSQKITKLLVLPLSISAVQYGKLSTFLAQHYKGRFQSSSF